MTWIAASGTTYKVPLLDTNAISEISKYPARYGRGFIERFSPDAYAPCFTPYSLVELRRRPDVYGKFLAFFGQYPCFITRPYNDILAAELAANGPLSTEKVLLNAFTPLGPNKSYDLREFLEHLFQQPELHQVHQHLRSKDQEILAEWLKNAKNFYTPRSAPNAADAERYVNMAAIDTLASIAPGWVKRHLKSGTIPDVKKLPCLQVMLYNQYYRLFNSKRRPLSQDVTDVRIMACSPYVDAVVTERFQADLFTKLRNRIPGLKSLEIARLSDIRWKVENEPGTEQSASDVIN
jgi:hypothetical protein